MSNVVAHELVAILIDLRQCLDNDLLQQAAARAEELEQGGLLFNTSIDNARFLALKGEILYRRAEYGQALMSAQEGLALVIATGENDLIAELQSTLAQSLTELGKISEAEKVYRDLVSTYRRLDDTVGVIRSLNRLSRVCFIRGRYDRAVECLLEAGDYAAGLSEPKWTARIKGNLGTILNLTGEFHTAVEYLTESAKLNRLLDNRQNLCRSHLSLAFAFMHLKNFRAAEENLAIAEELVGNFETETISLGQYRALLALLKLEPAKALALAQVTLNRSLAVSPESASVCQIGRIIAEAQYQLDDLKAAARSATSALAVAREIDQRIEIGACRRVLGTITHDTGELEESKRHFAAAIDHLSQCGARFELALTYQVWSRLASDPLARSEYRQIASGILSSLNLDGLYLRQTKARPGDAGTGIELIGEDPRFVALVKHARICAESDLPVLLLGETGSGKDQFARFVHHHSSRSKGTLVQVNCAAIPVDLAESELFGYEKGAFTNAVEQKTGLIEAADGGTLFLNEIGELPPKLQAKLLAALEEKRFFKLGSTVPRKVNFRLIAATNVDLRRAVSDGKFRSDLYFRLAVMTLDVPRLSTRRNDAFLLFRHFLVHEQVDIEQVSGATLSALQERCHQYDWPGNVRELKNYVELFCLTEHRDAEGICRRLIARLEPKTADVVEDRRPLTLPEELERFEQSRIGQALGSCGGVIRRAANFLGLPEATLRSKMKKYRMSAA